MKVLGIIAEYNPFHKGHRYHLERSMEMTGCDCAVAVMSGNFTQRGEISPWDKWTRSKYAVLAGVNLVAELPFVYACNQGSEFAKGAVDILASMGVDFISFGSESGDIKQLQALVAQMDLHADEIEQITDELMKEGNSFAHSRTEAVAQVLGEDMAEPLDSPNNLLAMEYIKRINYHNKLAEEAALAAEDSNVEGATVAKQIKIVTVERHGSGYFESNIRSGFAGASEIRKMVEAEDFEAASGYLPKATKPMLTDRCPWMDDSRQRVFNTIKADAIRIPADQLSEIYCMGEGLEYKIKKEAFKATTYDELVEALTSRRYPASAMRRVMLYMLMNLRGEELPQGKYVRVLAADKTGRELIRELKKTDDAPTIITNVNKDIPEDDESRACLEIDLQAADMYNFVCSCDMQEWSDKKIMPYIEKDVE